MFQKEAKCIISLHLKCVFHKINLLYIDSCKGYFFFWIIRNFIIFALKSLSFYSWINVIFEFYYPCSLIHLCTDTKENQWSCVSIFKSNDTWKECQIVPICYCWKPKSRADILPSWSSRKFLKYGFAPRTWVKVWGWGRGCCIFIIVVLSPGYHILFYYYFLNVLTILTIYLDFVSHSGSAMLGSHNKFSEINPCHVSGKKILLQKVIYS